MQTKQLRKRVLSSRRYTPQWKGFVEGFVTNFLKKNYWRVQSHMEYDDVMQEAYVKFLYLKRKYGALDTPQHFMALYKISWVNDFHELSTLASKHRLEVCEHQLLDEDSDYFNMIESVVGDTNNDGELSVMIEQAPSDVKLVLQLMLTAPVEALEMFSAIWKQQGKKKEFNNTHLCEILGLPFKTDIVGKINSYFGK
jgi:hypothetical protein